jgi:hypothetical protein
MTYPGHLLAKSSAAIYDSPWKGLDACVADQETSRVMLEDNLHIHKKHSRPLLPRDWLQVRGLWIRVSQSGLGEGREQAVDNEPCCIYDRL